MAKHKHIKAGGKYIEPFFGAKEIPNVIWGKLVDICKKCGKVLTR